MTGRQLLAALDRFPAVVVTGARQTGKTRLVTPPPVARGRVFRTLDDLDDLDVLDVLERAERGPDGLVEEAPRLTLDEVQRAPDLLRAVKRAVDRGRTPGRFLLTGSANLLMMRRVSESLAGRAVYLDLWPMNEAEQAGRAGAGPWSAWLAAPDASQLQRSIRSAKPVADLASRIRVGGYPVPACTRRDSGGTRASRSRRCTAGSRSSRPRSRSCASRPAR